jgi:exodeoxyribonuclease VII large subunit
LERIHNTQLLLENYEMDIEKALDRSLLRYGERVGGLDARLYASSPLAVMKRGYVMALNEKEKAIISVNQVDVGEVIRFRLQDGRIKAKVLKKAVEAYGEEEADL